MKFKSFIIGIAMLGLVGCANTVTIMNSDGSSVEMPKDVYIAQKQNEQALALAEKFSGAFAPTDAELTEVGEVADAMRKVTMMVLMPQLAQAMQTDGYWQYKTAKLNFWGNIAAGPATALLSPFANRLAYGKKGAAYGGGGYTEVNFGNRVAKGGGGADGESSSATSASGDNLFEDFRFSFGDNAPLNLGDGTYVTGKDAQYQSGDGVQGQALSRPFNQPQLESEGGDVNNDSEGFGVDGSLTN